MSRRSAPVYQLAFLTADYLIEQRGIERLRGYFASFKRSVDRRGNFATAFGITLGEFEADVLVRLKTAAAL